MTFIVGGTGTGYLQAWADWNANGSFDDDEQIVKDHPFSGSDTLSVAIPSTAKPGTTFLRIRYSSVKGIWAKGLAPDGEVEDYRIILLAPLTENDDDEDGDDDGNTGTPTSDEDDRAALPTSFALGQNYPNPFNPTTVIPFDLAAAGPVNIAVYDITGRLVKQLLNETMRAGRHTVTFNAIGIPSGVYMVRMTAGGQVITGKVALVK